MGLKRSIALELSKKPYQSNIPIPAITIPTFDIIPRGYHGILLKELEAKILRDIFALKEVKDFGKEKFDARINKRSS